jgi:hypothetical protein
MLAQIGANLGLLFCLYSLAFRWRGVVAKYGELSLIWWVFAVTVTWALFGLVLSFAIWGVEYAIWGVRYAIWLASQ